MDNSVYQAPESEISAYRTQKGSQLSAVAAATILDLVGSFVIAVIFYFIYSEYMGAQGFSSEQIDEQIATLSVFSLTYLPVIVLMLLFATYCGYLCARIVNYSEFKVVTYFAIAVLVPYVGIYLYDSTILLEDDLIFANIKIAFIYLGAFLYIKKGKKSVEAA